LSWLLCIQYVQWRHNRDSHFPHHLTDVDISDTEFLN
jgi:hypothetical protein